MTRCREIGQGYGLLKTSYRKAWLAENRPAWLDNILLKYDTHMRFWQKRADKFNEIESIWEKTGRMPKPKKIGIPQ